MENTNHVLETLNAISSDWANQFENKPVLSLNFQLSASGMLMLHGTEICPVAAVDPSSVFVNVESFGFFATNGEQYLFRVDWPYEGTPSITGYSVITVTDHALQAAAV